MGFIVSPGLYPEFAEIRDGKLIFEFFGVTMDIDVPIKKTVFEKSRICVNNPDIVCYLTNGTYSFILRRNGTAMVYVTETGIICAVFSCDMRKVDDLTHKVIKRYLGELVLNSQYIASVYAYMCTGCPTVHVCVDGIPLCVSMSNQQMQEFLQKLNTVSTKWPQPCFGIKECNSYDVCDTGYVRLPQKLIRFDGLHVLDNNLRCDYRVPGEVSAQGSLVLSDSVVYSTVRGKRACLYRIQSDTQIMTGTFDIEKGSIVECPDLLKLDMSETSMIGEVSGVITTPTTVDRMLQYLYLESDAIAVVDYLNIGVWVITPKRKYLYINETGEQFRRVETKQGEVNVPDFETYGVAVTKIVSKTGLQNLTRLKGRLTPDGKAYEIWTPDGIMKLFGITLKKDLDKTACAKHYQYLYTTPGCVGMVECDLGLGLLVKQDDCWLKFKLIK